MIKAGNLYVSLWTVVLVLFSALCGVLKWLLLSYSVLAVHELAHYFVSVRLKLKHNGLVLQPFGITLRLHDNCIREPSEEIMLCLAGPVANLCVAAGLYFALGTGEADVQFLMLSHLSIAGINLLPIVPLDGGRVLKAYLTARLGLLRAIRVTELVTCFFVLFVGVCAILALWQQSFNVSLMMLVAFLLFNMSTEKKNNAYLMMRQVAEYKQKLTKQKVIRVRNIAAQRDTLAKQIAAHFSYDKYHMVHLFDEQQRYCGCLTETQISDALLCRGNRVRLCEIKNCG